MLSLNQLELTFSALVQRYTHYPQKITGYWQEIVSKHGEAHRHYHTLTHVNAMVSSLLALPEELYQDKDSLLLSCFYHDIIYEPTRPDNEHQSALLFKARFSDTRFSALDTVVKQINATKAHKLSDDKDTNVLLDLDLAILGQSPKVYHHYCQQIRQEYAMYSDMDFYTGRVKVLKHFLAQDTIFKTRHFQHHFETQAISNLSNELQQCLALVMPD